MKYTTEQYWKKVTDIFENEYELVGEFKGITKRVGHLSIYMEFSNGLS